MYTKTIEVRDLSAADLEAADAIHISAFGGGESRQPDLRRFMSVQPGQWLLALYNGQPAGTVGALDFGSFAHLGMMAVHREFHRRGIGQALFTEILGWLDERKTPQTILDATEAGAPLYEKYGFIEDEATHVYVRSELSPLESRSFPVVHLLPEHLAQVFALDWEIFGAHRSHLLQAYLVDFPSRTLVAFDPNGLISGYLLVQARKLGPWIARTPEAAESLLSAALTLNFSGPPAVILPSTNLVGAELLHRYGFQLQNTLRHMRRGGTALPGRRELYYGQASLACG